VKQRLPLLSQKAWYSKLTYGYARGHEAYAYVENIRKYEISLVGYLLEKEKMAEKALQLSAGYPAVSPGEVKYAGTGVMPFVAWAPEEAFARMQLPTPPARLEPEPANNILSLLLSLFQRLFLRPAVAEEVAEHGGTLVGKHAFNHLHAMIHARMM
jgi:hypothetical protein